MLRIAEVFIASNPFMAIKRRGECGSFVKKELRIADRQYVIEIEPLDGDV